MNRVGVLICREVMEDLFSWRGASSYLLSIGVLSGFSVLLVSNRKLRMLDNAQAVYMMAAIVAALALLIAVIRGSDGFAGERERETLETLLATPVRGGELAMVKLSGILFLWLLLFALSIPYFWAVGGTKQNLQPALDYLLVVGTLLVLTFGGFTLAISSRLKTLKGTLSIGLSLFLLSGVPIVLGPFPGGGGAVGRFIETVNPLANALNMLGSVLVGRQDPSFQLLHLVIMVSYALAALWCLYLVTRRVEP
jgi:ABC-type transport system involved in multi-copper enzyme maturation permease subunit